MGYSSSIEAFEFVRELLQQLVDQPNERVTFLAEDPSRMAYLLRQGIYSASVHKVEPFNSLMYRFQVKPDSVIAIPKMQATGPSNKGVATVANKMSFFEIIFDLKQRNLQPGHEVVYNNVKGTIEPVLKFAEAHDLKIVTQTPLHIGKE